MTGEAELVKQPHGGALLKGGKRGPRKATVVVRAAFEEALQDTADTGVVAGIIRDAKNGDKDARRMVLEYGIGKPTEKVELSGDVSGSILLNPVLASLSDEELAERAKRIEEGK